ncbi:uncharacterized protein N7483_010968 [Penicillium malachiteum]|uniref:uncharacterized protein n=1 Tax=Penicillium malachiteum TaxID=1324776 RepID=UPI002547F630|nr:uncharacterized protein N7483_010968 [Penicillium malachiteum]KAJ5713787.1 hypothetical protein N7483_010968 [Penicillium malachiteum]
MSSWWISLKPAPAATLRNVLAAEATLSAAHLVTVDWKEVTILSMHHFQGQFREMRLRIL